MNDKCAGGTGAVIDKINAKLRIPAEQLCEMGYKGVKLHPVAGKCGVFAETDINGLQKMGVPPDELMASLFEAIVHAEPLGADARQHAAARGAAAGRPELLHQGHARLLEGQHPEDLGRAQHAAARGRSARRPDQDSRQRAVLRRASARVEFGKTEDDDVGQYIGYDKLEWYVNVGREEEKAEARRRRRTGQGRRRTRGVQGKVPHQEVHPDDVPAGRSGRRLRRHRRRLHLHQGRAAVEGPQAPHPRQDLPALQGQSDRGHDRGAAEAATRRFAIRARR